FELALPGPSDGNPFEKKLTAHFACGDASVDAIGFYDGDGVYRVRCMPSVPGTWKYETKSDVSELNGKTGEFVCEKPAGANHGPVRVVHSYHFAYADGAPYRQIGTTCYDWVHQVDALADQTVSTLKHSPFNKIRMCIFPTAKGKDDPIFLPFVKSADGAF